MAERQQILESIKKELEEYQRLTEKEYQVSAQMAQEEMSILEEGLYEEYQLMTDFDMGAF